MTVLQGSRRALSRYAGDCSRFNRLALVASASEAYPSQHFRAGERLFATLRRKRVAYENYDNPQLGTSTPVMNDPFVYSGDSVEEYTAKATLSPWTPVPDSVARRIFDIAQVQEDDIHVELGSGDGRVNFFALEFGVKQSTGIDVDENIVKIATDRLARIHPKPNINFLVADLMEPDCQAWKELDKATIITMYFAKEGLEKLRPLLEKSLRGRRCKIFTCGYAMPGWDSQLVETVLDMEIHFYDWGNTEVEDGFFSDSFIENMPTDFRTPEMDKFLKRKNSTFKPDPLKGYHPDDLIDFSWDETDRTTQDDQNSGDKKSKK